MQTSWSSSYSFPASLAVLNARVHQNLSEFLHCYWAITKILAVVWAYRFPFAVLGIVWFVIAFFLILALTITVGLLIERTGSMLPMRLKAILLASSNPIVSATVNGIIVSLIGRHALSVLLQWLLSSAVVLLVHSSLRRTSTHIKILSRLQVLDKLTAILLRERLQRQLPPEGWRLLVADARKHALLQLDRMYLFVRAWHLDVTRALSFERQSRIEERKIKRQARLQQRQSRRNDGKCPMEVFHGPVYL